MLSPSAPALAISGLTKTFDRPAVDALDLTVEAGRFYALLGTAPGRRRPCGWSRD
jgi:ABC-2 type transport system ATP-binding protein